MRCKFCGSKAIYPYKNHEQAGAGRVIAGAIIAGTVGAIAGLAGKNVKGYRCSACGMFSEQPMDFGEEMLVNSAVSDAKNGNVVIYERYQEKYANLEFVPIQQLATRNVARLTTADYEEEYEGADELVADEPVEDSVKHSYNPGQYVVGAPVFISNVTIKDEDGTDVLLLEACNISEKTLRSVYLNVTVYDDVGDQISTNTFAYQGLQTAPGEFLQQAKPFKLNTNIAYKVEVSCEKAAFADDSVWRKEESQTIYSVADKTELTPEGFAQYKHLRALLGKKSTLPSDRKLYYPVVEETHRLCVCGTPVTSGSKCPVCGLDEDTLSEVMDYDVLRQTRRDVIASTAKARTEALQMFKETAIEGLYQEARALMDKNTRAAYVQAAEFFMLIKEHKDASTLVTKCNEQAEQAAQKIYDNGKLLMSKRSPLGTPLIKNYQSAIIEFQKIGDWKDSNEQISICQQKIREIEEKEKADRLEQERQTQEAQELEQTKRRRRILYWCILGYFLLIFFIILIVQGIQSGAFL